MFSPQKQTEFDPTTVRDWPVQDAACHMEGRARPDSLLPRAVPRPGCWARARASGSLADSPAPAVTFRLPPPSKQGEQRPRQSFLPPRRTLPLPSSGQSSSDFVVIDTESSR